MKKVFVMSPEDRVCAAALEMTPTEYAQAKLELWESYYKVERGKVADWLRQRPNANYDPKWLADQIEAGEHLKC